MRTQTFVTLDRTLAYHLSMRVFPPVPTRLENTVHDVIRLAKADRNDATVWWYGKKTPVSQVVAECDLSAFVERGVWVATLNGSQRADFVLPKDDGSHFDLVEKAR